MENSTRVLSSRESISTKVVSAFGPNILRSYIHCNSRCCPYVRPHPYLKITIKKVKGPVQCMQLINAMQLLKQLLGMYFLFSRPSINHNHCSFALDTIMLGKSRRPFELCTIVQRLCHPGMSAL